MGGGSNAEGESLLCQLYFRSACKTKKNAAVQGSLKFREVSNSFWEGTRREKTRLKKVTYLLTYLLTNLLMSVRQSDQNMYFPQVFRSSNFAYIV